MNKIKVVGIEIMDGGILPTNAYNTDTGYDVFLPKNVSFGAYETKLIPLGIKLVIPDGYYFELVARSSLPKIGLVIPNSVGVIDQGYRGEIHLWLTNKLNKKTVINEGQAYAQLILKKRHDVDFVVVKKAKLNTARAGNGHGSSGR